MNKGAKKKLKKLYKKDLADKAEKEAHKLATMFFQHVIKPKPVNINKVTCNLTQIQ